MKKKNRIVNLIDDATIRENVSKTKLSPDMKKQLESFAIKFNNLLYEKEIHQAVFADKVNIGVTSISKYRNGTRMPKMEFIEIIAKELNVSVEYLLGKSEVKNFNNIALNKRFGLNDNSINNLDIIFNKKYLNVLFDNNLDDINYLLEEIKNYENDLNELKQINKNGKHYNIEVIEKKQNLKYTKFRLRDALTDLIDNYFDGKE